MGTFPPRSPPSRPSINDIRIPTTEIEKLNERIARLENSLEENRKILEEIRGLVKSQNSISRKIFESHWHEYKRPEKMKKFVVDETSAPIQEE